LILKKKANECRANEKIWNGLEDAEVEKRFALCHQSKPFDDRKKQWKIDIKIDEIDKAGDDDERERERETIGIVVRIT
jgi:hypothetical protein